MDFRLLTTFFNPLSSSQFLSVSMSIFRYSLLFIITLDNVCYATIISIQSFDDPHLYQQSQFHRIIVVFPCVHSPSNIHCYYRSLYSIQDSYVVNCAVLEVPKSNNSCWWSDCSLHIHSFANHHASLHIQGILSSQSRDYISLFFVFIFMDRYESSSCWRWYNAFWSSHNSNAKPSIYAH